MCLWEMLSVQGFSYIRTIRKRPFVLKRIIIFEEFIYFLKKIKLVSSDTRCGILGKWLSFPSRKRNGNFLLWALVKGKEIS